jgi:surface protein
MFIIFIKKLAIMKKFLLYISCILIFISCEEETVKYLLTTSSQPEIGGNVFPSTRQYEAGSTANLIASPADGYVFDKWTGATGDSVTTLVIDADKEVIGNFKRIQYALTVTIVGQGTVAEKVIKEGSITNYNGGTVVELTASPEDGWEFKEWSGALIGSTNPVEITLDKAKNVTATFIEKERFELTLINDGLGSVSKNLISGSAEGYSDGSTIELTASASAGWAFVKWAGGASGTDNPTRVTLNTNSTVIAVYKNMAPVVLDNDGITLRAKAGTAAGTTFEINSVTYTVVDNTMLKSWISAEKNLSTAVTTLVTDMKELFKDNASFNTNISSWDVSNVTTMEGMFEGAAYFNKDISKWDTNKVTNMDKMFKSATNFNQDLSKWCVTNLTTEPTDFVSGTSCDSDNKPKWGTWPDCPLIGTWQLDSWTGENGITRWNDGEKECENYPDELEIKGDDNTYGTYSYKGYVCFTNGDQMQTDEDSGYWQYTGDDNKVRVADKQVDLNNAPPWKLEYTSDYTYFTIVHTEYNDDQTDSWEVTEVWKRKN